MATNHIKVFVSYRRKDSQAYTEHIHDRLVQKFGQRNVFLDVDNYIPAGQEFPEVLKSHLDQADVVVVVIGPDWADMPEDTDATKRRLDNKNDFVRMEVQRGIEAEYVAVVPVLINDATMPANLPEPIRKLSELEPLSIRVFPNFDTDVQTLIESVEHAGFEMQSQNPNPRITYDNDFFLYLLDIHKEDAIANRNGNLTDKQTEVVDSPPINYNLLSFFVSTGYILFVLFIVYGTIIEEPGIDVDDVNTFIASPFCLSPGVLFMVASIVRPRRKAKEEKKKLEAESNTVKRFSGALRSVHRAQSAIAFQVGNAPVTLYPKTHDLDYIVQHLRQYEGSNIRVYRRDRSENAFLSLELDESSA